VTWASRRGGVAWPGQGHRVLRLEREGGKRATARLFPAVVRALEAYLDERATGPPIHYHRDEKAGQ